MADLRLILELITKGEGNLKQVSGDLDTIEKKTLNLGQTIKKGLAFGGGIVAAMGIKEGIEALGEAVNKAAEFQDTVSATGVIFGDEAVPAMEEFADTAASAFGASKQLALESANQMAVFGKSAGLVGDDLTSFATDMTKLGGDLASFFGGTTEEAITAIGAALRGESEPIRRYGVLLDDATLRAKAFELGLVSSTKNGLTPQVRVLAAQAEILEQTADAQGDFERTSDGMANTQRELGAELENLQLQIGEKLLPVFVELAHFIRDDLIPVAEFLIDDVFGKIGDGLTNLGNSFGAFLNDVGNIGVIFRNLITPWDGVNEAMTEFEANGKKTLTGFSKVQQKFVEESADAWEDYSESLSNAQFDADKLTDTQIRAMQDHWDEIRTAGSDMVAQYNLGIFEAQTDLQTEIDALMQALDERLTPGEEIAKLRGQKMQLMLARGIKEDQGDKGAVAAIDDLIAKINAQLTGLNGYDAGKKFTSSFAAGLVDPIVIDYVKGSAYKVALAARGIFPSSEPKDPNSPLRGITTAFGFGRVLADGMTSDLASVSSAASVLASEMVLRPNLSPTTASTLSGLPGASGGLSGGVTINLYVDGDLKASEDTLPGTLQRAIYVSGLMDPA